MGVRESAGGSSEGGNCNTSSGDVGLTTTSSSAIVVRRFPLAAQPEIIRAAEKDDQYASFVYDACRDAFRHRHLCGTKVAATSQNEVARPYGLPPTPARRALFIVQQSAVPYIAERVSSRIASRGINLDVSLSDDLHDDNATGSSQIRPSAITEIPSPSALGAPISALSRLKAKIKRLWLDAVQRWPLVLPLAREVLQLVLRTNLMFFYFEGLYYHVSKRAAGIHYVFIMRSQFTPNCS